MAKRPSLFLPLSNVGSRNHKEKESLLHVLGRAKTMKHVSLGSLFPAEAHAALLSRRRPPVCQMRPCPWRVPEDQCSDSLGPARPPLAARFGKQAGKGRQLVAATCAPKKHTKRTVGVNAKQPSQGRRADSEGEADADDEKRGGLATRAASSGNGDGDGGAD
ncbi:hypothetical protein T440DRAFT_520428 [Plenodomus tracheiphilus IPT5]|uniref:Uncharacterized protein n=1 Tax=Plenodomus tracheiphilus IPT5 TaxID=1408161 RepID=A0A6A7AYV5_9PLEO|nr:hypothetical protein T440DRAFT_520428 [Plenodomus tracheiphilus IPT5]